MSYAGTGNVIPGYLNIRGWTQGDLAEITGRPVQMINEIINGKKVITLTTACQLGAALGRDPEKILQMQAAHQLRVLNRDPAFRERLTQINERARGYALLLAFVDAFKNTAKDRR